MGGPVGLSSTSLGTTGQWVKGLDFWLDGLGSRNEHYRQPALVDSGTGAGAILCCVHQSGQCGRGISPEVESVLNVDVTLYDILHLLPSLPNTSDAAASSSRSPRSPSPAPTSSSWDSVPSDAEDTWYLSGDEEIEEYERAKKRRWLEALREERLRDREKEDEGERKVQAGQVGWGGDDEEPPDAIRTLMTHTATSMSKSPNPSLLEMRILANHSKDDRFAFLRGRWKNAWVNIKRKALGHDKKPDGAKLGMLMGGYDSDSDNDSDGAQPEPQESPPPAPPSPPPIPPELESVDPGTIIASIGASNSKLKDQDISSEETAAEDGAAEDGAAEEEKRRQRRARAEEWKRKRKLEADEAASRKTH